MRDPAQDDLGNRFSVPVGDLLQHRVRQNLAVGHGIIGGDRHTEALGRLYDGRLVEIGMIFDLVGDERQFAQRCRLAHQRLIEVRDADMAHLPCLGHLVQRADLLGKRHCSVRPMKKQEIDVIGLQLLQAFIDRSDKSVAAIVFDPDFCGQEQIRAGDAGVPDAIADFGLVAVDLGGVDVAIAIAKHMGHHAFGVRPRHAEGAETESGDGCAVGADDLHELSFRL